MTGDETIPCSSPTFFISLTLLDLRAKLRIKGVRVEKEDSRPEADSLMFNNVEFNATFRYDNAICGKGGCLVQTLMPMSLTMSNSR